MEPFCYCPCFHYPIITDNNTPPPQPFPIPHGDDIQAHNDTAFTIVLILFSHMCKKDYIGRDNVCTYKVLAPGSTMGASFFDKKHKHINQKNRGLSIEFFRIDNFTSIKKDIAATPNGYVLSTLFPVDPPATTVPAASSGLFSPKLTN